MFMPLSDLPPPAPVHNRPIHHLKAVEPRTKPGYTYMTEIRGPRLLISYLQSVDEGRISLVLDAINEDWHVDAFDNHNPVAMRRVLDKLERWGYHPIPEDECEGELLDSGAVRIYFYAERGAIIA